jgi:hypothetical protein
LSCRGVCLINRCCEISIDDFIEDFEERRKEFRVKDQTGLYGWRFAGDIQGSSGAFATRNPRAGVGGRLAGRSFTPLLINLNRQTTKMIM